MNSSFDATIPYIPENVKIFVPFPKDVPGKENLITTFSLSVWLTKGLVLLLTTALFWCAGSITYRSVCNVTHTYQ